MRLGAPFAPSSFDCTTPFCWLLFWVLTSMVIAGRIVRALQEKSGVGMRRRMYRLRARPLQGQWQQRSVREVWRRAEGPAGHRPCCFVAQPSAGAEGVGNCGVRAVDPRLYVLAVTGVVRARQIITGPWDAPRPLANAKAPVTVIPLGQAPGGPRLRANTLAAFSWAAWDRPPDRLHVSSSSRRQGAAASPSPLASIPTLLRPTLLCAASCGASILIAGRHSSRSRCGRSRRQSELRQCALWAPAAPRAELQALSPLNTTSAPQ